jgi:DNA-binding beta-propeller fold protein YncE
MKRVRLLAMLLLCSSSGAGTVAAQSAVDLYQQALVKERALGDAEGALRLYERLVREFGSNRALAAKAQFRIGMLYHRLRRKADAQRAFKTVVSQYPDQSDVASRAKARIAAARTNGKKAENAVVQRNGPSADGWYQATFTSLTEQGFLSPVIDPTENRLYVITYNNHEPRNDAEHKRIESQGLHYVYEPSNLIVIDTQKTSIIRTIPLSIYINEIAFNPANSKIYATAQVNGHVKVIDASTFAQIKIEVPGQPTAIAVNPSTNKIYVTSQGFAGNDKLFVIDGATNALAGPYDLGGVAGRLVVNSATNRIYAFAPPKTRVFNGSDNSVVADLARMLVLGADPVHNLLYAGTADAIPGKVQVLDGSNHSLIATLGFSTLISSIGIDASANRLYVAVGEKNQIAVIDTNTHTEVGRLLVADIPHFLAVDSKTGRVYICHVTNPRMIGVLTGRDLEGDFQEEFLDAFDSTTLDSSWTVVSGQGSYSLTENPGHLRFRLSKPSGSRPRLLISRKFRGEYWTLEIKTSYSTGASGGSRNLALSITIGALPAAGVLGKPINRTTVNSINILRVREDWDGCCPGEIRQDIWENGKSVSFKILEPNSADAYVWRIKRNGRTITIERSDDGINFALVDSYTFGRQIDGAIQFLGIGYDSHANDDAYIDFDYVRLTRSSSSQH